MAKPPNRSGPNDRRRPGKASKPFGDSADKRGKVPAGVKGKRPPKRGTKASSKAEQAKRVAQKPAAKPKPLRHEDGEPARIAKLLARAGVASRREVERMIADGRIAIDGKTVETPATILTSLKGVEVDGQQVAPPEETRLFVFHKPSGVLTAERDFTGRKTIYDVLPQDDDFPRLMPVGRLDLNTEGLLLLTNDGEYKRYMELPANGVERTYRARAFGKITQDQLEELAEGIHIDGVDYGRIDANLERRTGRNQWIEMTLTEGKNREVRRVLEYFGLKVSRLLRTRYGEYELGDLERGQIAEVAPPTFGR